MTPLRSFLALLLTASVFAGCQQAEPRQPAEHTYKVRGFVVSVAPDSQGKKQIKLRHEAIPQFFDAQGNSKPMHAMTMSFPVDEQIRIDDLQKGEEVEVTYEVRWKSSPRETISSLTRLPAGTVNLKKP